MKKLNQNLNCIKKFLFVGFCVALITCFSAIVYGQDLQKAPLNPEFVKYMEELNQPKLRRMSEHSLGLIPDPVLYNSAITSRKELISTSFPSKYDLRTAGIGGTSLLTSVKDQGTCGSCWTFATMGAIESYAKKMGKGDYDLSENNLKECHGFVFNSCEDGGTTGMSTAYLARGSGPVSELNDPYNVNIVGCKNNLHPEFSVSDIRYFPNDPNVIKQALLDYGALTTTMYMDDVKYYNSNDYTYYSTGATTTNHEVLLVGWDDAKITAGGTGAWIIKNSWGTGWGENGFFYISYKDTKINDQVRSFQNIKNRVLNSTQFGYDQLGRTLNRGYNANIGYGLIRFSPGNKNYTIKQLSTYVANGPATIKFEVYDDFDGTKLSNLMGTITDKSCDLAGYYTFDLPTPIQVSANNDFYIKVYYNTVDYNFPIPVEEFHSGIANPVIESGKCWVSSNGTSWEAIGSDKSTKADLCIKAYGEYVPCTPPINQATSFTSSALTNNSMTIKWARGNGNAVLVVARAENAVNEDPAYGITYTANAAFGSGSQIGTGNYVVYNGTGTSVNISALTSGKAYYYAVYEYNSASNCYLIPALTGTASTTGVTSYCAAGSSATTNEYISNVSIGSINQESGRGTSGYQDYTSQIATMYIGVNTTATIKVAGSYREDQILIWVDWNKDGDFTDPGENVYASTGSFVSPHTTANFAPPVGAIIGKTRMRIRLNYTSSINANATPCGDSSYGEVEDYTIDVVLPNPPVAPTTNAATNRLQTSFDANWNASPTVAGYRLDVATDIGFTTFVNGYNNKDVSNVTTYNVTGLIAHTQYYFRVRAYNVGGTSSSSVVVQATTLTNPPAAPIALTASSCNNLVTLKWRKNIDPYFIRYLIYGGPTSNSIIKIDASSDAISDTTKIISGLTNGQNYYFNVTAVNFDGPESTFSNQSSAKVKTGVIPKIKSKWGDLLICYNLGDSITNYQWFNGSALIPNAISQYYSTNKVASTYKVETIDINGCKNTSNTALTSGTKSLILYPNPASVSFSIKLKDVPGSNDNSEQEALVSIINSTGAKVLEFQAKNINDELLKAISVGHLSNGTYIVQVLLNQKDLYYSKIVVIK